MPVMRTGFTAAASARTGARISDEAVAEAARKSRRLSADTVFSNGIFIDVEP